MLLVGPPPGQDAQETAERLIAVELSNLGAYPPAISFRLAPAYDDARRAVIAWGKEVEGIRAADLVGEPESPEARTQRAECAEALRAALTAGPRPGPEVQKELRGLDFSTATTRRACADVGITREAGTIYQEKGAPHGGWMWRLPDGDQEGAEEHPGSVAHVSVAHLSDGEGEQLTTNPHGDWRNDLPDLASISGQLLVSRT